MRLDVTRVVFVSDPVDGAVPGHPGRGLPQRHSSAGFRGSASRAVPGPSLMRWDHSLVERLLATAVSLAVAAWCVHWAWDELVPVLPGLLVITIMVLAVVALVRYRSNRYW